MPLRLLVAAAMLACLTVGGAAWVTSQRPEVAVTAALVAALAAVLSAMLVVRPVTRRFAPLTAAARALRVELWPPGDASDDPAELARSVSQLTEAWRELNREMNILTAVLDGMAEGIWITDGAGTIVRHNAALKEMLYAGQDLVGQRPVEVLRNPELQEAVERACRDRATSRLEIAIEGVRPRTLAVHVAPLAREVGGSTAVLHDVTELRRLEKLRKDLVANVSHELRTPITAIRGYAETLRGGALADAHHAPKMVEIIHRQSERLSELVEDLLELSRLESRELQLERARVPLAEAAAQAVEAVRPKAESRGVRLEVRIPEGLSALGDRRGLEQVLLNLLDNAVKYNRPEGSVELDAFSEGARTVVRVRDTGVGIEARHLGRIFERFYRVDRGRSRDMGGTGLGLSIVKHLVTAMGGDVAVTSEPGRGSTFSISLRDGSSESPATE